MAKDFADCRDVVTLIGTAMGAASACWKNLEGAGEFDSEQCAEFLALAEKRMLELVPMLKGTHLWSEEIPLRGQAAADMAGPRLDDADERC